MKVNQRDVEKAMQIVADVAEMKGRYEAELDALRARVAELEQAVHNLHIVRGALTMERDRLRAALEAFPADDLRLGAVTHWVNTTRREALDG